MPFWQALDERERAELRSVARSRIYLAKMPLAHQGDRSSHVIVIETGWVMIASAIEAGHDVVLAMRGPGELVGEGSIFGRPRSATISALNTVGALMIPVDRFTGFLDAHPQAWHVVSKTLLQRLEESDRRMPMHASMAGTQRVALLLAELAEQSVTRLPPPPGPGIEIGPPLSQEELGSWVDVSRETVARSMTALRRHGLIRTNWRKIAVLDLPGLRKVAEGRPLPGRPQTTSPPIPAPFSNLTPAEWRVASLAARGLTNREIAQKLIVTRSTVEQHLARVFRKLKVHGREELARVIRTHDRTINTGETAE